MVDLDNLFSYHPPTAKQVESYTKLRDAGRLLAEAILDFAPNTSERDKAIAKVRESVMWANAAIACNEGQKSHVYLKPGEVKLPSTDLPAFGSHAGVADQLMQELRRGDVTTANKLRKQMGLEPLESLKPLNVLSPSEARDLEAEVQKLVVGPEAHNLACSMTDPRTSFADGSITDAIEEAQAELQDVEDKSRGPEHGPDNDTPGSD